MDQNQIHQVFISSTYNDLIDERAEVTQALLELDCLPSGMEAFPAANSTQWEWIKRVISNCDYYIVIIGGMYGSINEETGLSYTEMEYDYAIENNIPTIGFIIKDPGNLPSIKTESDPLKKEKLERFKEKVKNKLCKFYTNADNLGAIVSRSISSLKRSDPRPGWVRADSINNSITDKELIDLMKKNSDLKNEIEKLQIKQKLEENELLNKVHEIECLVYVNGYLQVDPQRIKLLWKDIVRFSLLFVDKEGSTLKEFGEISSIVTEREENINYYLTSESDRMIKAKLLIEGYVKYITTQRIILTKKGKEFLASLL